jgi:hypothetical protein
MQSVQPGYGSEWSDMRLGGEPVGRWGIVLMAVTGAVGIGLAVHGWSARASGITPTLASGSAPASPPAAAASASPTAAGSGTAAPSTAPSPAATAGPLLSSQPFASSAFQIWPGTPGTAARQALTGLSITVKKQGSGLQVTAGVIGQPGNQSHVYATGARVYVVEASLGDDSGNADYSLGDDGLVVTDSKGRIVQ